MEVRRAIEKSCPFANQFLCVADNCMAWRFTKTNVEYEDLSEYEKNEAVAPERYWKELPALDKEGFCILLDQHQGN